ncbi:hypothetical protein PVAND_015951 [Polypedilum vanderplanki]|uniref:Lipase domain-containing protein n=1 Tax=Polypedilum vanderplanki TaxID=319348 RepID=A0A9J6BE68_POLVA|nr:hypothetical protein PVAND_015951 [Polypedilum vanderplanki]
MFVKIFFIFSALITVAFSDSRIRFIFYQSPTQTTEYSTLNFFTLVNNPGFQRDQGLVVFHYGEGQTLTTPQVLDVVNSYAGNRNYNFVLVHYFNTNVVSTGNAVELAEGISTALIQLLENAFPADDLNLVGFGLGAQLIARVSRRIQERSNRRFIVGRLTGLEPIQLGMISGNNIGRLGPSDAAFVESIHTEGNQLGDHGSRGHIWFMVNGGQTQPMCDQTLPGNRAECSHIFVLNIWAESVRAISPVFPALACNAWAQFLSGVCNTNPIAHMGRSHPNTALRGSYFLQTNMQPPWSREQAHP